MKNFAIVFIIICLPSCLIAYFLGLPSQLTFICGYLVGVGLNEWLQFKKHKQVRESFLKMIKHVAPRTNVELRVIK